MKNVHGPPQHDERSRDGSTVVSACMILSKIQPDICSIDRNVTACIVTDTRKKMYILSACVVFR